MTRHSKLLAIAFALLCASCSMGELQFRNDHRVSITSPKRQATVVDPLTVRWTARDIDDASLFAVFVDRPPMKVGKNLRSLADDAASCERDLRCPSAAALATKGIYVTTGKQVRIEALPNVSSGVGDEQHFLYVVLLDSNGTRRSESAWYTSFKRERRLK